jgi:hypothetical protein
MARKAIAGTLLVAIAAWAELALAPMPAMHAGHMHRGRALPVEVISQNAGHDHTAAAGSRKHACCPPPIRHTQLQGTLELVADSSGCQGSHRCCFGQGPQSVPAPASEIRPLGPQIVAATPEQGTQTSNGSDTAVPTAPVASPPDPHIFGMTLRV